MLKFFLLLLLNGDAQIDENFTVYAGKHPQTQQRDFVCAIRYDLDF